MYNNICLDMQYGILDFLEGSIYILRVLKKITIEIGLLGLLCGCGSQTAILTTVTEQDQTILQSETTQTELQEETSSTETDTMTEKEVEMAAVYVCGAVKNPGVYYVSAGAIKETAVLMAGGFEADADETYINLAEPVSSGEQIYIPTREETAGASLTDREQRAGTETSGNTDTAETDGKININTAEKEQLMTLPGIGESKADAIIAYRQAQGNFQSTEELMNIRGIKKGVYDKIKDLIIVG